jgi:hypothetical protein
VWFTIGGARRSRANPEEIETAVVLEPLITNQDGTIYRVKPKE